MLVKYRNPLLFLLLVVLIPSLLPAQKPIDEGIKSYENGQYEAAINSLDEGLRDPSQLKDKVLAKAYCYRGLSKVRFLIKARLDTPENMEELGRQYSLTAYEDFKQARKYDSDQKLEEELAPGQLKLMNVLLDLCGDADKKLQTTGLSEDEIKTLADDLVSFAPPVFEMDKYNYRAYDFYGDGLYAQGKFKEALQTYKLTDDWFFRSAPKSGDLGIGYTYIRLAELEWKVNQDFTAAMAFLDEGRERLAGEDKKIQNLGNRRPAEKASFKIMYDDIFGEMAKMEETIRKMAGKEK